MQASRTCIPDNVFKLKEDPNKILFPKMKLIGLLVVCASLFHRIICQSSGADKYIRKLTPQTSKETQEKAVLSLIERVIGDRFQEFQVKIDPVISSEKDVFKLEKIDNKIQITATTGVAASNGFYYYLKTFCKCHISWESSQLNLPVTLPDVNVIKTITDKLRYYQNVCTSSYSFVWWSWKQWEKHIDWIALNGFNLVLAFTGQEAIWDRVYRKFNLTDKDINEHFSGPAFLSWLRMGNMRGYDGPLSSSWHRRSISLQKNILKRMRELGIITVHPAFAGHLPRPFKNLYPDLHMDKMKVWYGFNDSYCCPYFLDPVEDLFKQIGSTFLSEQIKEFGTDHVYNCDSFNENDPTSTDLTYLSNVGKSIFAAMTDVDPDAIWILQGWMFHYLGGFWDHQDRAKAILTSVPQGKMIVLDLQSEMYPVYDKFHQYYGQPYIWCMLHNFGGGLGMHGSTDIVNENPIVARTAENSTMVGIGLTMEGINQNYYIYDFMMENSWRTAPVNLTLWTRNYHTRRYGKLNSNADKAWQLLQGSVYNLKDQVKLRGKYAITMTPNLNYSPFVWYNYEDVLTAWEYLLAASDDLGNNEGYLHDLVDVTRQSLQTIGEMLYDLLIKSYNKKSKDIYNEKSQLFLKLLQDLEKLLKTNKAFLFGPWIEDAKNCASNSEEEKQFIHNAKNHITLWGPRGEIKNYAIKQWAGVVEDFYYTRWKIFIDYLKEILNSEEDFDEDYIKKKMFEVEEEFIFMNKTYDTEPVGDTISVVKIIFETWRYNGTNFCEQVACNDHCFNDLLIYGASWKYGGINYKKKKF